MQTKNLCAATERLSRACQAIERIRQDERYGDQRGNGWAVRLAENELEKARIAYDLAKRHEFSVGAF